MYPQWRWISCHDVTALALECWMLFLVKADSNSLSRKFRLVQCVERLRVELIYIFSCILAKCGEKTMCPCRWRRAPAGREFRLPWHPKTTKNSANCIFAARAKRGGVWVEDLEALATGTCVVRFENPFWEPRKRNTGVSRNEGPGTRTSEDIRHDATANLPLVLRYSWMMINSLSLFKNNV